MVTGHIETYENLIASAKKEFAAKGYDNASIRSIAGGAGLTIGALYQHFNNKEDLYNHIVSPLVDGFISISKSKKGDFIDILETGNLTDISREIGLVKDLFLKYIFENWQGFRILISNEQTRIYKSFFEKIVSSETEMTLLMIKRLNLDSYRHLSYQKLKTIISAQYRGIFALMKSENDMENLKEDLLLLLEFFRCGWDGLMGKVCD